MNTLFGYLISELYQGGGGGGHTLKCPNRMNISLQVKCLKSDIRRAAWAIQYTYTIIIIEI